MGASNDKSYRFIRCAVMNDQVSFILFDGVMLLFNLMLIVMVPVLISGLIVGVFQAATQINEQALGFIAKLIVLVITLILLAPLMTQMWVEFATKIMKLIMTL